MGNLRNSNKKDYLKWTSNPSYISPKMLDNGLVAIGKSKVNKLAYVGICILDLVAVLMYEFHNYYIKNKYGNNSRLLFTDNDSLIYETSRDQKIFDLKKLVVGKVKC